MNKLEQRWKYSFFILLTIVLIGIGIMIGFLRYYFPPVEENKINMKKGISVDQVEIFTINTTKEQLNNFVVNQLDADYNLVFDERELIFETTIPVLSYNVLTKIHLEPQVIENGDLLLKGNSISVGRVELPEEYVLQFIKNYIELPKWVNIFPTEKAIYIEMMNIDISNNIGIRFNEFSLEEDRIIIGIYNN